MDSGSVAQNGMDALRTLVSNLRSIGLKVSLDDFGTEYSNLSVLINNDFDEIKLDKSLIDHMCTDPKAQCILKNVVNMCRELGSTHIVAEGVETTEQSKKIQECSCSHGQGYLLYKPMPILEYLKLLERIRDT